MAADMGRGGTHRDCAAHSPSDGRQHPYVRAGGGGDPKSPVCNGTPQSAPQSPRGTPKGAPQKPPPSINTGQGAPKGAPQNPIGGHQGTPKAPSAMGIPGVHPKALVGYLRVHPKAPPQHQYRARSTQRRTPKPYRGHRDHPRVHPKGTERPITQSCPPQTPVGHRGHPKQHSPPSSPSPPSLLPPTALGSPIPPTPNGGPSPSCCPPGVSVGRGDASGLRCGERRQRVTPIPPGAAFPYDPPMMTPL